jgi:mono/diheme cytochrome c family protein
MIDMDENLKKRIKERYEQSLQRGERFWPDSIYKDLLVSFALFVLLILLATFVGVPVEPKADPSDATYVPRPEWYFLFLFKFLALYGQLPIIGKIEWVAAAVAPGIGLLVLLLLPFIERNPYRHYSKRAIAIATMGVIVTAIVALTILSAIPTASTAEGYLTFASLLQMAAGLAIPGLALLILFLSPILFKNAEQRDPRRLFPRTVTAVAVVSILALTLVVAVPAWVYAEPVEEVTVAATLPEKILLGQDLFALHCVECHGDDGTVTTIEGVEGLEGKVISPINSKDVMYTFTDETLFNIIAYGQQDLGMPPLGKAFGGELSPSEMEYIVAFMRYTWDDRAELPPAVVQAQAMPTLGADEVPSYEVHIQPIVKRYCISCHRPGKKNNNYLMRTYEETMTSGDHTPNVIAGDMNSNMLLMLYRQEIEAGGPMPPTKALKPELIAIFERWIAAGAPNTAEEATSLSPSPSVETPTPSP